jgi:hypothetical protein
MNRAAIIMVRFMTAPASARVTPRDQQARAFITVELGSSVLSNYADIRQHYEQAAADPNGGGALTAS